MNRGVLKLDLMIEYFATLLFILCRADFIAFLCPYSAPTIFPSRLTQGSSKASNPWG